MTNKNHNAPSTNFDLLDYMCGNTEDAVCSKEYKTPNEKDFLQTLVEEPSIHVLNLNDESQWKEESPLPPQQIEIPSPFQREADDVDVLDVVFHRVESIVCCVEEEQDSNEVLKNREDQWLVKTQSLMIFDDDEESQETAPVSDQDPTSPRKNRKNRRTRKNRHSRNTKWWCCNSRSISQQVIASDMDPKGKMPLLRRQASF